MRDDLLTAFAYRFKVPVPAVQQLATELAEQCALIANRFEPEGELESLDLGLVEAVGAEIGAAILTAFPPPMRVVRDPEEVRRGLGIGGPEKRA